MKFLSNAVIAIAARLAPRSPYVAGLRADRLGRVTSEWKLTIATQLISIVVAIAALYAPALPAEALREVLLWVAGVVVTGTTAAYSIGRAQVKTAAINREAAAVNAAERTRVANQMAAAAAALNTPRRARRPAAARAKKAKAN